jgi:hypothetical protein
VYLSSSARLQKPILPSDLGRWFMARAKIYLVVILVIVGGFFFVAGWLDDASDASSSNELVRTGYIICALLVGLVPYEMLRSRRRKFGPGSDHKEKEPAHH